MLTLFKNDEVEITDCNGKFMTVWYKSGKTLVANHFSETHLAFYFAATKQADNGLAMWESMGAMFCAQVLQLKKAYEQALKERAERRAEIRRGESA